MLIWRRTIHGLLILSIIATGTLPATGQTPLPPQTPNSSTSVLPSTFSQTMPDQLVGIDPGKTVQWTLKDAILAALNKNPDIEINRENVRIAQFDLFAAQGAFDPLTTSTILYNAQRTPNAFRFSGTLQNVVRTDSLIYNFGLTRYVEQTGGFYQFNFNNSRVTSNTSNLATSYNSSFSGSFRQPLLRNYRNDLNRHQVQLAKKRLDISDAQFRQQVIEVINTVQNAYWDLAFAIRNEQIQRDAVNLAATQLRNNQRQAEVGTLAPIEVVSAAAQVEANRQQVYQAMQIVARAENNLKALTVDGPDADLWTTRIVPVESFEIETIKISLPEAIKLALSNRPEVKTFELQKEANRIEVEFNRNQTLPQVDLIASYSTNGLAGTPAIVIDEGGVPRPVAIDPDFVGSYPTALKNLLSNSYPTWQVGVSFSFPLRNRTASANLGRSLATSRQVNEQLRRQLQLIEAEVRNAYQATQAAQLRVDAARAARQYAEQQLSGEERKFAAGLSTTFLVLERQTDLSQARGVELRALTDYNKAVADLQRASAATLTSNNIDIKSQIPAPSPNGKP